MQTILLQTPVVGEKAEWTISQKDPIMLVGSCFVDAIGQRLEHSGWDVCCNPFGVMYNPFSIADCLQRCMDRKPLEPSALVERDGLWHSWYHHGSFSRRDRDDCLETCNVSVEKGYDALQKSHVLVVTFGTAYVFELKENKSVVANCHKVPARYFERYRLSVEAIVERWKFLFENLRQLNPQLKVIFTVSPIRHLADTAHGNQLSKSVLLLSTEQLCGERSDYFPAYEIVLDELRDYRYYDRDMVHPNDLAADIVWNRFQQYYMTLETQQQAAEAYKAFRASQHRPINI